MTAYPAPLMGIAAAEHEFLQACTQVRFDRTMMLGRQRFVGLAGRTGFAEPLFEELGAREVRSLDASDWERATDIHDLNLPLPENLRGRFSAVVDSGTLEHVFNFPQALRSAMELVELDGHLILMAPTNDQPGHGFYQFSPDLFFRALTPDNGFTVERCAFKEDHGAWYDVKDPADVGRRLEFRTRKSSMLFVIARRVRIVPVFETWPQQSDYARAWSGGAPAATTSAATRRLLRTGIGAPIMRLRARYFYPPSYRRRRSQFRKLKNL